MTPPEGHPVSRMRFAVAAGFPSGDQFFAYLKDSFDTLYAEGKAGRSRMMSIGLHCRLERGVCLMDGIDGEVRANGGFVIVRGGGVPALDVIGYNRRVDWDELVNRLQRVIAENVSPELR